MLNVRQALFGQYKRKLHNKSQCRVTSTTSADTFTRINHNVRSPAQPQPTHLPGLGMKKYIHNKIK